MLNVSLRGALESYVDDLAITMDILAEAFGFETKHEACMAIQLGAMMKKANCGKL